MRAKSTVSPLVGQLRTASFLGAAGRSLGSGGAANGEPTTPRRPVGEPRLGFRQRLGDGADVGSVTAGNDQICGAR